MNRAPRTSGAIPIRSGVKSPRAKALTRAEARDFLAHLDEALGNTAAPRQRKLRHFSDLDSIIAKVRPLTSDEATDQALDTLCALREKGFHGIRKELTYLLILAARLARHDGYSLRVLADSSHQALR